MINMMQGDAYKVSLEIECDNGLADESLFEEIELILGSIRKTKSAGDITYDALSHEFSFSLTQEETFAIGNTAIPAQLRVKTKDGDVIGTSLGKICFNFSMSKEVL